MMFRSSLGYIVLNYRIERKLPKLVSVSDMKFRVCSLDPSFSLSLSLSPPLPLSNSFLESSLS